MERKRERLPVHMVAVGLLGLIFLAAVVVIGLIWEVGLLGMVLFVLGLICLGISVANTRSRRASRTRIENRLGIGF